MNNIYLQSWCLEKVSIYSNLDSHCTPIGPWFCCNSDLLPRLLEARTKEGHVTSELSTDETAVNKNSAKELFSESDKKQFTLVFWV